MRRRREEPAGSLDSLLDTMTNVVGILVILLVVTQLGVSSAVKRIRSSLPEVSEAQFEAAQRLSEQHAAELKQLEALQHQDAETASKARADLAALQKRVKELQSRKPAQSTVNPEDQRRDLAAKQKRVAALRPSIEGLKKEVASLTADLDAAKASKGIPAEVVRLPDPRPAPAGVQPEYFYCRNGRIVHIDRSAAAQIAAKRMSFMKNQLRYGKAKSRLGGGLSKGGASSRKLGASKPGTSVELDRSKAIKYFESTRVMSGDHRLFLAAQDVHNVCWVVMAVSTRRGDSVRSLMAGNSRVRAILRNVKRRGSYARFIVHPDSFEVYLKAREMADALSIPAGWTLFGNPKWNSGQIVPGIRLHRDRQPPPPDPNKKPGPAPKPKNVLD